MSNLHFHWVQLTRASAMLLDDGDGAKRDSEADKGMGDFCKVVCDSNGIAWMKQRDVRAMMFGQWTQDGAL